MQKITANVTHFGFEVQQYEFIEVVCDGTSFFLRLLDFLDTVCNT
jgi:hypothetical protein